MIIMKLSDIDIQVKRHDIFKTKSVIMIPSEQDISFKELLSLFETEDLSEISFYYKKLSSDNITFIYELEEIMTGYTKLCGFNNNLESKMYTFQLEKPSQEDIIGDLLRNNQLQQMQYAFSVMTTSFSDEQALNCVNLFPKYKLDFGYEVGDRFEYEGKLYKVIQKHKSQKDWYPDKTKSLYVEISDPAIEYPEFVQPTGAHDAYKKGDKVTYDSNRYVSLVDNNVYSPKDYPNNWQKV